MAAAIAFPRLAGRASDTCSCDPARQLAIGDCHGPVDVVAHLSPDRPGERRLR